MRRSAWPPTRTSRPGSAVAPAMRHPRTATASARRSPPDPEGRGGNRPDKRDVGPLALNRDELERVIRRAAELQSREGESPEFALDETEVVRIGEEVGLSPRHVRQALADLRAESLLPDLPNETSLAARLWGPGLVRESRVVLGDASAGEAKLETVDLLG